MKNFRTVHSFFLLLLTVAAAITACAPSTINFRQDLAINNALESLQPIPGYDYYYSGPDSFPLAILGVPSGQKFRQGLWKKVDLTPERLEIWMRSIDNPHRSISTRYHGKYILGPDGQTLGIWYSPQEWPNVRLSPENELSVTTPPNTLYPKIIENAGAFP